MSFVYILSIRNNFVSSVERGRYALTRAIVEDKKLSIDKYKDFSAPDLSLKNGHYYSRFPAGMSFMMTPFHKIALKFSTQIPYIFEFGIISIIAALTISLFYIIGRLGDFSAGPSFIVSISFGVSTLIYSFAGGFWSHIFSILFITLCLISFLIFYNKKKLISILFFGLFYALSISIDYPNAIIIFPLFLLIIVSLFKSSKKKMFSGIFLLLIPLLVFGSAISLYNKSTFGSPFKIGQSSGSSVGSRFKASIIPIKVWNAEGVFDDRRLFPGLISQTLSPERGILIFSPVLLLAIFGFFNLYKRDKHLSIALLSIVSLNIIFYSIWQDYWGGWSYGPRYLIASIPILILPLLYFLKYSSRKLLAEFIFCITVIWGIIINSIGAFTGTLLPCPCEGYIGIWYSPVYAIKQLETVAPNSFFYKNYLINIVNPYIYLVLIIGFLSLSFLFSTYLFLRKETINEA